MWFERNLKCDLCGKSRMMTAEGEAPRIMSPFLMLTGLKGRSIIIRTVGVCAECYLVVCSECSSKGRCPKCGFFLLGDAPDPPSWLHPVKRLKWLFKFGGQ